MDASPEVYSCAGDQFRWADNRIASIRVLPVTQAADGSWLYAQKDSTLKDLYFTPYATFMAGMSPVRAF